MDEFYKIQKGFQAPRRSKHDNHPLPLEQLEIGDSFVMPQSRYGTYLNKKRVMYQEFGRDFTTRKVTQDTRRVWRIK